MSKQAPHLTAEEYNALLPFEQHLNTALNNNWTRNPGRPALDIIEKILQRTAYPNYKIYRSCGTCILNACKSVAKLFFAYKAEEEAAQAPAPEAPAPKKVATTDKPSKTVKAKAVKTTSKK